MEKKRNCWLIQTDKPSKLHLWSDKDGTRLEFCEIEYSNTRNTQHIYITNSEEIKEGDSYLVRHNIEGHILSDRMILCKANKSFMTSHYIKELKNVWFKVILSTDQDLIKDGVQAIDNEFLEWFVKNPSCEEVEVNDWLDTNGNIAFGGDKRYQICNHLHDKIIIPKEEPANPNNQEVMFHQEHQEHFYEDFVDGKLVTVWLGKDYIAKEKPKQETTEEEARDACNASQERSYSEEEVINAYNDAYHKGYNVGHGDAESHPLALTIASNIHKDREQWFNQFKKSK